ncbi:SIS domain-containing protein [Chloroflexota bacterium]
MLAENNKESFVKEQIEQSIQCKAGLYVEITKIVEVANVMIKALRAGNKVILFGNGGSAADAQHIAAELVGKLYRDRPPLPAIALTTNSSLITAIANDFGYEKVFSRQLQCLIHKGDIVIGISTSGSSKNIVDGITEARKYGATTIALIGKKGKLKELADYVISVQSEQTPHIQEAHILIGHIICYLIEEDLFGD